MLNHSALFKRLAVAFALVMILLSASTAQAQSGRRVREPASVSAPTPEPEPSPTPNVPAQKPKPLYTFVVGLDRNNGFANIPSYAYDGALRSFVERLAKSLVVEVGGTQSDMSRSDAIQKAKAEKEGLVVWLDLHFDSMTRSDQNSGSMDDIVIDYFVFTPTTAKVATTGRTYTASQRNKGIITGSRTGIYGDRYVNQAAEEAADRVFAYVRTHGTSPPPPSKLP